ncbi:hypothetical protein OHA99_05815 [Streptomyces coelicoflavus]|uniref:hypothetical protein n=1 Tax=Streptomyces coelicoflavus TaxID=285562 RepID=UPI0032502C35
MTDDPGRPAIHALLTDGTTVRIRAVEPEDHARLHRLHETTSPDNLRMRFFAVRPHSAAVAADHACEPPRPGHRALVAGPRGRIIGLAAYDGGEEQGSAELAAAGLGALGDLGLRRPDNDVRDPVLVTGLHASRTHELTAGEKEANRVVAVGRAPLEHGSVHLKNGRSPAEPRIGPARATQPPRALLVPTNLEVERCFPSVREVPDAGLRRSLPDGRS